MNENVEKIGNAADVPYIVFESAQARMERTIHKLWIVILLLIVLLVGSNVAWIVYESQWEDVTVTQEVSQTTDQGGANTNILSMGDYDGEAENKNDGENPTP